MKTPGKCVGMFGSAKIIIYEPWDDPMLDEGKIAKDVNCIITLRGLLGKALPNLYGVNECHYYDDDRAPCLYSNVYHLGPKVIRGGNTYTIYLSHLTDRVRFRIKEGYDTLFKKDFLFGDPMMVRDLKTFANHHVLELWNEEY